MKNITIMFMLTISISFSSAYAGSAPDINEGTWEITTTMEMPGMPVDMPPTKHTQCITKKDLVPQSSQENQDCVITDMKSSGNTVSWSMQCKSSAGTSKGTGKITYSKNSFKGTFTTIIPQMNMKMTSTMTGRRTGPCK